MVKVPCGMECKQEILVTNTGGLICYTSTIFILRQWITRWEFVDNLCTVQVVNFLMIFVRLHFFSWSKVVISLLLFFNKVLSKHNSFPNLVDWLINLPYKKIILTLKIKSILEIKSNSNQKRMLGSQKYMLFFVINST